MLFRKKQAFLQIIDVLANFLIVYRLGVFGQKWLNLLTKWYIVVKCGKILYIFASYK